MALQFENPWLLLLLLPAAVLMYYTTKNMLHLVRWRRISIVLLRSLVFLMVILLLTGFTLQQVSGTTTTLFLADSSDSIRQKEQVTTFTREAIKNMGRKDKAGIINFGGDSTIELLPDQHPIFEELQTRINPSYTNLENALVTVQSMMPWDHQKRVVLLTDGRENTGNALLQIKQMKSKGYVVDVYPVNSGFQKEVQLQELKIPDAVHLKEQFEITVNVKSNINTKAVLQLYSNRLLAARKEVVLNKGDNQFAFSDKAANGGMVTYRVEVLADSDTISQNNELSSYTYVRDIPEIMMIQGAEGSGSALEAILHEDMHLTVVNPMQVPAEMPEMLKYDAFILSNVSVDSLSDTFLNNMETAVSHQGKGLLVTGGDNSYGPGGYYKTTLEKILPVNMDIKPKEEEPNLALMLVIDKSGSMSGGDFGISKMELAREAAIRSTEVLKQKDMIGVIGFDDAFKWVVEPQNMERLQAIQDAIGTIRSGGGTQILPAMETAYDAIQKMDAKLKHIILLTDGQAEKSGYEPLIEGLREKGITLSTVAVGRSADTLLMKALAYGGRGRYYETDEFTDIPRIFTKEVFLAGKKYLTNRTFIPRQSDSSDILKGIDAVPQLDGYVTTTAKQTANIIFESDEKDPVMASWQYGLGRTVAWTPDTQGIWTYNWMNWKNASLFWENTVSWLIQQNMSKGYSVKSEIVGQDGIITVQAQDDAFMTASEVNGTLVGPDGVQQEIKLLPGAPGEYTGSFTDMKSGVYIADITLSGSDGRSERISTGLIMPYSPEYDLLTGTNEPLLQKIVYEGGGRILEDPAQVFKSQLPPVTGKTDPTHILLIAVFILLILDVALRRLNPNKELWKKKLEPVFASGKAAADRFTLATERKIRKERDQGKKNIIKKEKHIKMEKDLISIDSDAKRMRTLIKPIQKSERNKSKPEMDSHISQLLDKKRKWKR
jgi:Mg-chelatase subunit ChlD